MLASLAARVKLAPSSANRWAMPLPMPRLAPVISTLFVSKRFIRGGCWFGLLVSFRGLATVNRGAGCHLFLGASDDLRKTAGIQGSASHQRPVDVRLAHQFMRVFRFNVAPVGDLDPLRDRGIKR